MMRRPSLVRGLDQIFVHAGVRPKRSLDDQGEREFLWIREPFLRAGASRLH